jgi:hypothetical protein
MQADYEKTKNFLRLQRCSQTVATYGYYRSNIVVPLIYYDRSSIVTKNIVLWRGGNKKISMFKLFDCSQIYLKSQHCSTLI